MRRVLVAVAGALALAALLTALVTFGEPDREETHQCRGPASAAVAREDGTVVGLRQGSRVVETRVWLAPQITDYPVWPASGARKSPDALLVRGQPSVQLLTCEGLLYKISYPECNDEWGAGYIDAVTKQGVNAVAITATRNTAGCAEMALVAA
jgi:hypothetical protein